MEDQYSNEYVVLVNEEDAGIGLMPKMEAHEKGSLHRAFSVFIFNTNGDLLLQQRASSKYHSPGLWSNTCCSHPRSGEPVGAAAGRRLWEEMGMRCKLTPAFHFIYRAELDHNLIEHEYDHVFFGITDDAPEVNTGEVQNWTYMQPAALLEEIKLHPEKYTEWLKIIIEKVISFRKGDKAG